MSVCVCLCCRDYRWEEYPARAHYVRHPQDNSLMTYRGHRVLATLIRAYFSPIHTTAQRFIYAGSADGSVYIYGKTALTCPSVSPRPVPLACSSVPPVSPLLLPCPTAPFSPPSPPSPVPWSMLALSAHFHCLKLPVLLCCYSQMWFCNQVQSVLGSAKRKCSGIDLLKAFSAVRCCAATGSIYILSSPLVLLLLC